MKNKYKTKKQLVEELEALQKQAEKLKKTETRAKQAGKPSSAAQYWQTMFDTINDAVSMIDKNGKITQCNKAMASLLQKPMSEIIGHKCWELMHGTSEPIPGCPIVRMKETLKRETLTLPIGDRWFEVITDPIFDKAGKLTGAVHIIVDITERKRVEKEKDIFFERNQSLITALGEIVYDWHVLTNKLIWEGEYTRILGYTKDEMGEDTESWTGRVHPADLPFVLAEGENAV